MPDARVLVVDDEPQIRRALRTALTGHGYTVDLAEDGESALVAIASSPPDAVVLDLIMPGIDGFQVIRETRAWSSVPIVVVSARGRDADKVEALDIGADDYLTKPFSIDELLARLRAVLRRATRGAENLVAFGDVVVDLGRRVVTKGDAELHLTPTEYSLLRVLVLDADRVLTHRQLLERVWGAYAVSSPQQLRVYVNAVRGKIEDEPAKPRWLVTELGVGYRLRTHG